MSMYKTIFYLLQLSFEHFVQIRTKLFHILLRNLFLLLFSMESHHKLLTPVIYKANRPRVSDKLTWQKCTNKYILTPAGEHFFSVVSNGCAFIQAAPQSFSSGFGFAPQFSTTGLFVGHN